MNFTFIHSGDEPVTEQTFEEGPCEMQYMWQLPADGFFLSRKINENSNDKKSYWIKFCEDNPRYDQWTKFTRTEYKLKKDAKVLIVTKENFMEVFKKWGYFIPPKGNHNQKKIDEFTKEIHELTNFQNTFKYKYNTEDEEELKKCFKQNNGKGKYKINPGKKSKKVWFHITCRLRYLYQEIYKMSQIDQNDLSWVITWYHGDYTLDHTEIKKEYDAIYFPIELFSHTYQYTHDTLFMRLVLDVIGTDTLIAYRWCFE